MGFFMLCFSKSLVQGEIWSLFSPQLTADTVCGKGWVSRCAWDGQGLLLCLLRYRPLPPSLALPLGAQRGGMLVPCSHHSGHTAAPEKQFACYQQVGLCTFKRKKKPQHFPGFEVKTTNPPTRPTQRAVKVFLSSSTSNNSVSKKLVTNKTDVA